MTSVLAIDTTTRGGSVALAEDGEVRALAHHDPKAGYAESLLELCDEVRAQASVAWESVDGIAVVRGPGSFTGLRIGIMTAKTLAYARGWTLWAADSLPLLAAAAGLDDTKVRLALLAAGGGHVFAAALAPGAVHADPERLAWEELADWAASLAPDAEVAVEAAARSAAVAALPGRRVHAADALAATLARRASRDEPPALRVEPDRLLPLYASPSQAERVHGVDLRDRVHRRIDPTGWE